jgi:hypothetical protein
MQSENISVENISKIGFQQPLNPEHGIVKLPKITQITTSPRKRHL